MTEMIVFSMYRGLWQLAVSVEINGGKNKQVRSPRGDLVVDWGMYVCR